MNPQTSLILLLISFLSILSYLITVFIIYGWQSSISESYYRWPKEINFIFTIAIWLFAIPIVIAAESGILFFAGSFICVVGAAENFHNPFIRRYHVAAAIIGIGLGMMSIIIDYNNWISPAIFGVSLLIMYFLKFKNLTLWAEIAALICVEASLFTHFISLI
jgi:hypothetical protein